MLAVGQHFLLCKAKSLLDFPPFNPVEVGSADDIA